MASGYGAGVDGKEVYHNNASEGMEAWNPGNEGAGGEKEKKRICGLSRKGFWIAVAVVGVVVLAGAVGGGVGGAMGSKRGRSSESSGDNTGGTSGLDQATIPSSSAPSTTRTTSSASPTSTPRLDDANCPLVNGTTITSSSSEFTVLCDTNIIGVGRTIDLGSVRASSLQSCVDVCTEWNANLRSDTGTGTREGEKCVAVSWAVNIPGVSTAGQGNYKICWYKWARSLRQYTPDLTEGLGSVSAVLVE